MKVWTMLILMCLSMSGPVAGGVVDDSLLITSALRNPPVQKGPASAKNVGTIRSVLGFAKYAYERFVSSQDGSTCCFSESCSNFCVSVVLDRGVINGVLLTSDRLTRCNGIQKDRYVTDSLSGKNIDDVLRRIK